MLSWIIPAEQSKIMTDVQAVCKAIMALRAAGWFDKSDIAGEYIIEIVMDLYDAGIIRGSK